MPAASPCLPPITYHPFHAPSKVLAHPPQPKSKPDSPPPDPPFRPLPLRLLAGESADPATRQVVDRVQRPHASQLLQSWVGLVQDVAVATSQPPEVQLQYTPALLRGRSASVVEGEAGGSGGEGEGGMGGGADSGGPAPAALIATVQPLLGKVWPVVLGAASCSLGADSAEQHAMLLDFCQLMLCAVGRTLSAQHAQQGGRNGTAGGHGAGPHAFSSETRAVLAAMKRLTAPEFSSPAWLPVEMLAESVACLQQLVHLQLATPHPSAAAAFVGGPKGSRLQPGGWVTTAATIMQQLATALASASAATAMSPQQLADAAAASADLAAASECIANACLSGGVDDGEAAGALQAALDTLLQQVQSAAALVAGGTAPSSQPLPAFIAVLEQALAAGVRVLGSAQRAEQLEAAAVFIAGLARAAATAAAVGAGEKLSVQAAAVAQEEGEGDDSSLPSVQEVLASAALGVQSVAGDASFEEGVLRVGPCIASLLALGAALASAPSAARTAGAGAGAEGGDEASELVVNDDTNLEADDDGEGWAADVDGALQSAALPALLPGGQQAGGSDAPAAAASEAAQAVCLEVLSAAASSADSATRVAALQALRAHVQAASSQHHDQAPSNSWAWSYRCVVAALPPAATSVHELMQRGRAESLDEAQTQVGVVSM
jgi:hypothetical protein